MIVGKASKTKEQEERKKEENMRLESEEGYGGERGMRGTYVQGSSSNSSNSSREAPTNLQLSKIRLGLCG